MGSGIVTIKPELKLGGPAADEAFVEVARRPVNSSAQPGVFPETALEPGVGDGEVEGGKVEGLAQYDAMSLGKLLYSVLIEEGRTTDESA